MTSALLMLAMSMDVLTRLYILQSSFEFWLIFKILTFFTVLLYSQHFGYVLDNLANPPLSSFVLVRLFLQSQGSFALRVKKHIFCLCVANRCCPLARVFIQYSVPTNKNYIVQDTPTMDNRRKKLNFIKDFVSISLNFTLSMSNVRSMFIRVTKCFRLNQTSSFE